MDRAKITLSAQEHRLMMDPSVILTKNRVMAKVYELFGECSRHCVPMFTLPSEVAVIMPKIAKGETYKGLPYVMLDFPRYFTQNEALAIRTFFWWGNYVSVTLHLKGKYIALYQDALIRHFSKLSAHGFAMAISDDEWDHDLNGSGYLHLGKAGVERLEAQIAEGSFVKISCSFSLENWDELPQRLLDSYELLGEVVNLKGE